MDTVDITVIGAGVVGLAIAARLANGKHSVYVLERHDAFGRETSSRNSEVIHAGIYYSPGSMKARLCVQGNPMLYEICRKHKVGCRKIEKLIVALDSQEEVELEELFEKGRSNAAAGLTMVSGAEAKKLEPHIEAKAAIHSASTGIIDTHNLMRYFTHAIKEQKGEISYNSCVSSLRHTALGYEITLRDKAQEEFIFRSACVINSAGLNSDTIAALLGIDTRQAGYELKYCKGQYFRVHNRRAAGMINRLVYPLPRENSAGLGVHATLDLSGGMRLGPDSRYVARDNFNYDVEAGERSNFFLSAKKFLPFLKEENLLPDTAGIRPKLSGADEPVRDFVIQEESSRGFPGFINLIGIESPGLTASLAIAEYVEKLLDHIN